MRIGRRQVLKGGLTAVLLATGSMAASGPWADAEAARLLRKYGYRRTRVSELSEGQKIALSRIDEQALTRGEIRARITSILGRGVLGFNRRR